MTNKIDLQLLEHNLKMRLAYPYQWGMRQSDDWDAKTNFIYTTRDFSVLEEKTKNFELQLKNYTYNRWLNFWSAVGVEQVFCSHQGVQPNLNYRDKLVDFKINTICFDHKTSVYPKAFAKPLAQAVHNKSELIQWLYENQSQQGRKHLKNRLFVVLYNTQNPAEHWKLKAEIALLKEKIDRYVLTFAPEGLTELDFGEGKVLSDIIWVIS